MSATLDTAGTRVRQGRVLVVDDDDGTLLLLGERLGNAHYEVATAGNVQQALDAAAADLFDVILLDVHLPDASGLEALRRFKSGSITAAVVMISGAGDAETVVEAMRLGALDYLVKPLAAEKVLATVSLAVRAGRLERENRRLMRKLQELEAGTQLVGHSPAARRLATVVRRVADSDATVLIEGKPGSGKTLIAETIHRSGRRCDEPLVHVLAEGLEVDAFQDMLAEAEHGTLVIDDVEQLPAATQSRLVRCLKERPASADGAAVPVRIIAATSARLPELVARGKFREDLFYRLNVFPIVVPSLQERRDDIPLLAAHFLAEAVDGKPTQGFTTAAMILLETHPWPGNLTQLRNAVARAFALAAGGPIDRVHLLGPSTGIHVEEAQHGLTRLDRTDDDEDVREEDVIPFEAEEKRILARALRATRGNVRRAAQLLRIGRATLYRKIQVYKLRLH